MKESTLLLSPAPASASLFRVTLDMLNAFAPMRASFDDFTGITLDYPQLLLPVSHEIHDCSACLYAKQSDRGQRDCTLNKHASNRLAIRHRAGFGGLCHLGLFDLVEPLIVREAVLGAFYYGSVVVVEREAESRRRVERYCARRGLDAGDYLTAWRAVPRIREMDIAGHRERLRAVAESARLWCEALAIPVERYPPLAENVHWVSHRALPPLIRTALRFVARRFGESCQVADIAVHAGCNASYLSAEFKRHTGENLTYHIEWVRLDRAKALLRARQLSVGEIAFRCGFADPSHFVRVFKRRTGLTPKKFQAQMDEPKKSSIFNRTAG
jgi:AraC-like DNA-binding protein